MHESRPNVQIPGYEVVIVTRRDRSPPWGELRHPSREPLRGAQAFKTALAEVGHDDPELLAALALAFVDPHAAGKSPWRPGRPVLGDASPSPPVVQGRTLRYWRTHTRMAEMVIVQVDLQTGRASVQRAKEADPSASMSAAERLVEAKAARDADHVDALRAALSELSKLDNDEVHAFLTEFLASEQRPFLRRVTVEAIGRNAPARGDVILGRVLSEDANPEVRRAAARALDNWSQPEGARASLEQAAADDDDLAVRAIAARALSKLP